MPRGHDRPRGIRNCGEILDSALPRHAPGPNPNQYAHRNALTKEHIMTTEHAAARLDLTGRRHHTPAARTGRRVRRVRTTASQGRAPGRASSRPPRATATPDTSTAHPGPATWDALQRLAAKGGYTGPNDGVMGPCIVEGRPDRPHGIRLCRPHRRHPGTGHEHGAPGPGAHRRLLRPLRRRPRTELLEGRADRAHRGRVHGPRRRRPGPNTWKALQRIAQRGGYAGPVDGVPGPNTYAGLAKLLLRSEHD